VAAHTRWANVDDPTEATKPAREAFLARFEREVDPEKKLSNAERTRRATHLKKAYFTRLALKSAKARRARATG
jgi:hypothetical protein